MMMEAAIQPQCIVRLSGGLGNQLFQYGAGRATSLRTGSALRIDTSFYWRKRKRARALELARFSVAGVLDPIPIKFQLATRFKSALRQKLQETITYREPHQHFDAAFESLQAPVVLEGYFQSDRYFRKYAEQIRQDLAIPPASDESSLRLAQQMKGTEATSLHIRRGDYVTDKAAQAIYASCSLDYYHQAMEEIPGRNPVFVFSDDLAWAKANLRDVKPLVFSDDKSPRLAMADFWLMSLAHHHIVANSTFSWWAAWLADPGKGITIAPKKWFADGTHLDDDIVPSHWLRI